jgi:hypothetical protein
MRNVYKILVKKTAMVVINCNIWVYMEGQGNAKISLEKNMEGGVDWIHLALDRISCGSLKTKYKLSCHIRRDKILE